MKAEEEGELSEILPGKLYLSDYAAAGCLESLQRHGIQGVVALGNGTQIERYSVHPDPMRYKFFFVDDREDEPIHEHFTDAIEFIKQVDGAVLVHCWAGISRSATIVMAYLIVEHRMSFPEASSYVSQRRKCVQPNHGFLRQLRQLALAQRPNPQGAPPECAKDFACPELLRDVIRQQQALMKSQLENRPKRKCAGVANCVCCACTQDKIAIYTRWAELMALRNKALDLEEQTQLGQ